MGAAVFGDVYHYRFAEGLPLQEVEDSLMLAAMAAEGLHGRTRLRLEARFELLPRDRSCRIEASTAVGHDLARIFTGLLSQQFGEEGFSVEKSVGYADAQSL